MARTYHGDVSSTGIYHGSTRASGRAGISVEDSPLPTDERHVALPKLYGAPAYARPQAPIASTPRPFDPDELPLEADRTEDERDLASNLPARAYAPGGGDAGGSSAGGGRSSALRPRSLNLRSIAGKLLGGS